VDGAAQQRGEWMHRRRGYRGAIAGSAIPKHAPAENAAPCRRGNPGFRRLARR
jgi:hypothetical protein